MVMLLSLLSCDLQPDPGEDSVTVEAPAVEGSLRIATAPDRAERPRARVIPRDLPQTPVRYQDCFGWADKDGAVTGGVIGGRMPPPARKGDRRRSSRARPAAPPAASAPAATPSPAPLLDAGGDAGPPPAAPLGGLLDAIGYADAPARDQAPMAEEERRVAADPPEGPARQAAPEAEPPPKTETTGEEQREAEALGDAEATEDEADDGTEVAQDAAEPRLDWGATVHLSNDDSMSLASAQRVLYALTRGARLSLSEIRPHELLNYFSFDTAGPPTDQMFSVLGAAEANDDTLTVSLAVHGANPDRRPLDLTVLLDRSCSMQGEGRMDYTKRGLTLLTDQLQEGDRLDVVLFSSDVCTPVEGFVVGRDDPAELTRTIGQLAPTGGTDLNAGLTEALRVQRSRDAGRSTAATDA